MAFAVGRAAQVRDQNTGRWYTGKIVDSDDYESHVEIRITRQQARAADWHYSEVDENGKYIVHLYHRNDDKENFRVTREVPLTAEQKAEIATLKAKTNRSPVEEYMLSSLEEEC